MAHLFASLWAKPVLFSLVIFTLDQQKKHIVNKIIRLDSNIRLQRQGRDTEIPCQQLDSPEDKLLDLFFLVVFYKYYFCVYFWLHWSFIAVCKLSSCRKQELL